MSLLRDVSLHSFFRIPATSFETPADSFASLRGHNLFALGNYTFELLDAIQLQISIHSRNTIDKTLKIEIKNKIIAIGRRGTLGN